MNANSIQYLVQWLKGLAAMCPVVNVITCSVSLSAQQPYFTADKFRESGLSSNLNPMPPYLKNKTKAIGK